MKDTFHVFGFIRSQIGDILIITKIYWTENLEKLYITIDNLKGEWLKYNIETYFFGHTEMEYLSFWFTHKDAILVFNTILHVKPPKNKWGIRKFLSLLKYDQYMWDRKSHILHPLTTITSLYISIDFITIVKS